MEASKILIVEDEGVVALVLKKSLLRLGYNVTGVTDSGRQAIDQAAADPPDLILMDIQLKGELDGIETTRRIMERQSVPVVFLTAHSDAATLDLAKSVTPYGYLIKPFEQRNLYVTIEMAVYKHRMEQKLKQEEDNFRNLAETANDGILITDAEGLLLYTNRRATEITGYNVRELLNIHFDDLVDNATDRECLRTSGIPKRCEAAIRRKTGEHTHIELTGTQTHWQGEPALLVLVRDISKRKAIEDRNRILETQIRQTRKLKTIGTLAGGLARDFNNILSAIIGNAEILKMHELDSATQVHYSVDQIIKAVQRAETLVRQILTFSQQKEHGVKVLHATPLIQEAVTLMQASLPASVALGQEMRADGDTIIADAVLIHQLVMNLCTNAVQALQHRQGKVTVRLYNRCVEASEQVSGPGPGQYLVLEVADTGPGIPEDIRDRIFEPYFTTNRRGDGSGLGLSVVYGIVQSLSGTITVDSEPGAGAVFRIYLPLCLNASEMAETTASALTSKDGEHVLLVDRGPVPAEVGKRSLEAIGYTVTVQTDSLEALRIFHDHPQRFDAVVTDMHMPVMAGDKLAREMMAIRPDLPVVLCVESGDPIDETKAMQSGIRSFITKPMDQQQLAGALRRVLDGGNPQ